MELGAKARSASSKLAELIQGKSETTGILGASETTVSKYAEEFGPETRQPLYSLKQKQAWLEEIKARLSRGEASNQQAYAREKGVSKATASRLFKQARQKSQAVN